MIKIDENKIDYSIEHYGENIQHIVCMEELAELIQALSKFERAYFDKRVIGARDNIVEETADVMICIATIRKIHNITDEELQKYIDIKQQREVSRINSLR